MKHPALTHNNIENPVARIWTGAQVAKTIAALEEAGYEKVVHHNITRVGIIETDQVFFASMEDGGDKHLVRYNTELFQG
jgi:hypothetical protein|tara:strand:+ start:5115 stop:5351 length:237 start_codon:yes stop_codon:yes gene_type:complete